VYSFFKQCLIGLKVSLVILLENQRVETRTKSKQLRQEFVMLQLRIDKVGIFWPNQNGRGTHVNVSGAAVLKHAKNTDNAKKF